MQRYNPRGIYSGIMDPCENGAYVLADETQDEIDALHAECDRLTALLQWEQSRREEARKTCKWHVSLDGFRKTICGKEFVMFAGMMFCPFCGYKIEETP